MAHGAVRDKVQAPRPRTAGDSGLLTPEEVASFLRVTRRTVYAWLKIGRLRGLRAGKSWRIHPADLKAFLTPSKEWEQRLDASIALTRSQVPTDISEGEIDAAIEAARDAVHKEHRARGHR